jgi:hypothetical protein
MIRAHGHHFPISACDEVSEEQTRCSPHMHLHEKDHSSFVIHSIYCSKLLECKIYGAARNTASVRSHVGQNADCRSIRTVLSHCALTSQLQRGAYLQTCSGCNDDESESYTHGCTILPALGHQKVLPFAVRIVPEPPEHQNRAPDIN